MEKGEGVARRGRERRKKSSHPLSPTPVSRTQKMKGISSETWVNIRRGVPLTGCIKDKAEGS